MPSGSPQFGRPSVLVSEYRAGNVATYEVDANGDPLVASRRLVVSGLAGAEGALVDPVTGDFIFSTFGGAGRVIVVSGFRAPPPVLPPPVAGKSVNAFTSRGRVRVKVPGGRFVTLGPGRQIPVGTTIDTLEGRVQLEAAGDQTATFYDGIFKLGQGKGAKPLTTLRLVERLRCPRGGKAGAAAKRKKKRGLWGDGSGRFRTDGKFSSATVRGTKWLVEDRCGRTRGPWRVCLGMRGKSAMRCRMALLPDICRSRRQAFQENPPGGLPRLPHPAAIDVRHVARVEPIS